MKKLQNTLASVGPFTKLCSDFVVISYVIIVVQKRLNAFTSVLK